jgi:peptidyl-prolyl cis-trans isomerase SurA
VNSNFLKKQPQHLLLGLIILFSTQSFSLAYSPLDHIVAVVNEDVIMKSELENKIYTINEKMKEQGANTPPESILKRQVLNNLIQNRIQLQLAAKIGIKVNDENLNRTISNIAAESQITLEQFREILEKDGYNYEQFREDIRNEIALTQLRKRRVANRIIVSEKEIDNFLTNDNSQSIFQTEMRLSHILFSLSETAAEDEITQTEQMALKVRDELLTGADFAKIASTVSDGGNAKAGGDLGWRRIDDIPTLFTDYIPDMKVGDISELIRSPSGFHIIKISDLKDMEENIVEQTHARHILVKVNELRTDKQVNEKLIQLKLRIDNGDDFGLLAKGNSDDAMSAINNGDLDWSIPGELVPEFQRVLDGLEINETSEPFKSRFGWHIVQVLERRNHDNTESIKRARARKVIGDRKLNEALQNWNRELLDEAYIEYRLDDI